MIRRALAVGVIGLAVAAPIAFGAALSLTAGSLTVFTVVPQLPVAVASVDIKPESLERRSQGPPVTVFIEAPSGAFDVRRILPESVRLCGVGLLCDGGVAIDGKPKVGDADGDGIPDLKVTFARSSVLALVIHVPAPSTVTFVVSAVLSDGTACSGSDTVRLVDPDRQAGPSGSPEPDPPPAASPAPTLSPPTPEPAPGSLEPTPSAPASPEPSTSASPEPTPEPSVAPTPSPTPEPSPEPSVEPTPSPTPAPEPTPELSAEPTSSASLEPIGADAA